MKAYCISRYKDLMLNSGVTHVFRDVSNGNMAGLCLNCVWPVADDYDAFDVNPTDWLNAAAELAKVLLL